MLKLYLLNAYYNSKDQKEKGKILKQIILSVEESMRLSFYLPTTVIHAKEEQGKIIDFQVKLYEGWYKDYFPLIYYPKYTHDLLIEGQSESVIEINSIRAGLEFLKAIFHIRIAFNSGPENQKKKVSWAYSLNEFPLSRIFEYEKEIFKAFKNDYTPDMEKHSTRMTLLVKGMMLFDPDELH